MSTKNAIILFGGRAYAAEMNIHASMPASQLLRGLEEMSETRFMLMPHGEVSCAGFARLEDRRFFLMYFPPRRRQLIWKNKYSGEQRAFIVWWPHVYIGVFFRGGAIEDGYAMCSREKLRSTKDPIGRLPLPNLSKKYGHICEGGKGMWNIMARPEDTAQQYAEYFWKSQWISDINDHWNYVPREFWPPGADFSQGSIHESKIEEMNQGILGIWESISETDPRAVEKLAWPQHFSVEDLVHMEWKGKPSMDGQTILTAEQISQIMGSQISALAGNGSGGSAGAGTQGMVAMVGGQVVQLT